MKRLLLLVFIALIGNISIAQTADDFKDLWLKAEGFYIDGDFPSALTVYEELLQIEPENSNLHFRIAFCLLESANGNKVKAVNFFEKACQNLTDNYSPTSWKEKKAPIDAWLFLGQTYHILNDFDKAMMAYEKYRALVGDFPEAIKEVDRLEQIVKTAKTLVAAPRDIKISNLGDNINGSYSEYAPVISADEKTLIFTSRRENSTGGEKLIDGSYYEDIYITHKDKNDNWQEAKPISSKINTNGHEATIGLSVDGSQLLIYRDENGDGNIWYSKLEGDSWSTPVRLGPTINTKGQETHAVFTADGNTIYFTSDRKGGYGGLDIYRVKKLPNGEWSAAQNLGPKINTEFDERAPFMHPDGVSLFFSSQGHETMGGFDIFVSTYNDMDYTWTKPENVGYPINSTDDDVFYVTSTDAKRAYYASAKGQENYGDIDIYMITMETQPAAALTVMTGNLTIGDGNEVPEGATITVTDNETGEIVGIYRPNSKTGKYLFILPPGKDYNVSYEAKGYLFESDNLMIPENTVYAQIEKPVALNPIQAGEKIILNNIFFEFDSDALTKNSKVELSKLFNLMVNNTDVKIEISGHTDSKGSDAYNEKLSQKRAESVVNYLIEKGIKSSRMVAKGYGETQPIAINENEDGSDNEEGRALNRRIELKIIESKGNKDIVKDIDVPDQLKK